MSAKKPRKEVLTREQLAEQIASVRMLTVCQDVPVDKLTPLESQVVGIRRKVPQNAILLVNCGYKMKFFGRDARIASRRTGIMCIPTVPFETASVPVQRTMHYVGRLVNCGYVVGVVDQTDTAAIRGVEGKSGLFERSLKRLFSRGTSSADEFVEAARPPAASMKGDDGDDGEEEVEDAAPAGPTIAVRDASILFLRQRSGDELEVLFVNFSQRLKKVESWESTSWEASAQACVFSCDPAEVVAFGPIAPEVVSILDKLLSLNFGPTDEAEEDDKQTPFTSVSGSKSTMTLADAAADHLGPFDHGSFIQQWGTTDPKEAAAPTFELPSTTLDKLEIFRGPGRKRNDTLHHILTQGCRTSLGARQIRAFLVAPLAASRDIESRQNAVQYLLNSDKEHRQKWNELVGCVVGDWSAASLRLSSGRGSVADMRNLIRGLAAIIEKATALRESSTDSVLQAYCDDIAAHEGPSSPQQMVSEVLSKLDLSASDPVSLFESAVTKYVPSALADHAARRSEALEALNGDLVAARNASGFSTLSYKSVSGVDYLLEVSAAAAKKVPSTWTVVSRTKTCSRYRNADIDKHHTELCAANDRHKIAAQQAWAELQCELFGNPAQNSQLPNLAKLVERSLKCVGMVDALLGLAAHASHPGLCRPTISPACTALRVNGLRHAIQSSGADGYIGNDVSFTEGGGGWLLTGANMGGKSALLRSIGLAAVLAHIGAWVPADSANIPLYSTIECRMGSSDRILEGSSTFFTEMEETTAIVGLPPDKFRRSLVLMDELGRGTSSFDGVAVASATLTALIRGGCHFIFVTHFANLCDPFRSSGGDADSPETKSIKCKFMDYRLEDVEGDGDPALRQRVRFLYKAVDGVCPSSFGVNVAQVAGISHGVAAVAGKMSQDLMSRSALGICKKLLNP